MSMDRGRVGHQRILCWQNTNVNTQTNPLALNVRILEDSLETPTQKPSPLSRPFRPLFPGGVKITYFVIRPEISKTSATRYSMTAAM